ncbi:hypothetical protein HDF26_005035 [Pedobacter cryoconitis]|uniref:Lipoprotein n=1 Tax=Pedobacter cryoconitis TaxID=188932 RepID=A0A7W8ZLT2_9SPHI|nr:hypothetical protein [Pedobacter cryoconitis]MBB5636387.1 hypothetical protein [Pedobacter cryoconitis]MBB6274557.1 hypothetical protein [Pedobacter cryoconitis]
MSTIKNLFVILLFTISFCNAQEKTAGTSAQDKFNYAGFINKNIPVELSLTILGDHTVFGEIKYLDAKPVLPVKIIGVYSENGNDFTLAEFQKNGNVSGVIRADLKNLNIDGEWGSTKSDDSYPINVVFKSHESIKQEISANRNVEGEYAYHYAETGFDGVIKITKEKNGTYSYVIGTVTGEKIRDTANASGSGLTLNNDEFIIEVNKNCRFRVDFYDGFLKISAVDDDPGACGFSGTNATLRGAYLKIK